MPDKRVRTDRRTGNPPGPAKGTKQRRTRLIEQAAKHAQERLTVEIGIDEIRKLTPLQVLEHAMYYSVEAAVKAERAGDQLKLWMIASTLAEKAAPYRHSRLANVTVDATVKRDIGDFTDAELIAIASAHCGDDGTDEAAVRPH